MNVEELRKRLRQGVYFGRKSEDVKKVLDKLKLTPMSQQM